MNRRRMMRLLVGFGAAALFALPLTSCQKDEAGESDLLSRPASADAEDGVLWDEESAPAEGGMNASSTASTKKVSEASEDQKIETPTTKPAPSASTTRPDIGTTTAASPDGGMTTVSTARPGGVTTVPPIDDSGFGPIVKP